MSFQLPPIVKLAEQLLVDIEQAVRRFHKDFKHQIGAELRTQAMNIARIAHRAWRQPSRRVEWLTNMVEAVDDLKLTMQLGVRIKAFASFSQFEALARVLRELGRQVGGGHKRQHPKGQNPTPRVAPERAQILSTRATPIGVNQ